MQDTLCCTDALKSPVTATRTSGSMGREDKTREDPEFPTNAEGARTGRASIPLLAWEEGVAQTLLVGHDTIWNIRVRGLRGGTHCTQRSEDVRDTIGERLAGAVKVAVMCLDVRRRLIAEGERTSEKRVVRESKGSSSLRRVAATVYATRPPAPLRCRPIYCAFYSGARYPYGFR